MIGKYPKQLIALISQLKKLPGVGSKTAERFAFQLLKWNEEELQDLGNSLNKLKEELICCENCGCFKVDKSCPFCDAQKRDQSIICILSSPKDVFAIEETRSYSGLYHIIDAIISPYDLYNNPTIDIEKLKKRINTLSIKEAILAFDSTLEGETTSLLLKKELQKIPSLKISRIASGIPVGSHLEYVDGGTLAKSILGRQNF